MRIVAFAATMALASASRVHDFFAENNYICAVCELAVEYASEGNIAELDKLYELHPALQTKINAYESQPQLINMADKRQTCQNMNLCTDEQVMDLLLEEQPLDLDQHIQAVNSNPNSTWVAGHNEKFSGASKKEVKAMLGAIVDPEWAINLHPKDTKYTSADFPENFDARTNWPECNSVINHVRDQSNCGSCWAHGTTEALNDRKCIASGGSFTTLLSTADTTGCCNFAHCFSMGCNGGQVGTPWNWFMSEGVVTGGDYGDTSLCYAYTFEECAHHVSSETLPSCDDAAGSAPTCPKSCPSNTSIDWKSDRHTADSSYGFRSVDAIKADIYQYGSVTAAFTVYEDFLTYQSGVYQHQSGSQLGGHAIKTIGWGTEDGQDYWLCVNSWNNTWGDEGTFKILMGNCGINRQMHAGLVH